MDGKGEQMSDCMTFPDSAEEFMEQYKITDTDHVYSNGIEFVPIFRMKQWFEHLEDAQEIQPDRMKLVQQAVNTIMNTSKSDSIRDRAFRNAARFVQCAIDGEAPDFEQIPEGDEMALDAQPESTRTFVELVVRYPDPELCTYKEYKGKPYYSIKYIENGETYVGYGTYNPEVLSQYLKEYFISSTQHEKMDRYGYIGIETLLNFCENSKDHSVAPNDFMMMNRVRMPSEPKWIPCRERLPDKDGLYLVTYFSGRARWTGTDELLVDGTGELHWKYANVIAWMSRPEPYMEEGE